MGKATALTPAAIERLQNNRLTDPQTPGLTPPDRACVGSVPSKGALVEGYVDRVPWGTDWPHLDMEVVLPDGGLLVDEVPQIAITVELQRKLLIDNPIRL